MGSKTIFLFFVTHVIQLSTSYNFWGQKNSDSFSKCKPSTLILDCFDRNISAIIKEKSFITGQVIKVDLQLNNLKKIVNGDFTGGSGLKELRLSFNNISFIGENAFQTFPSLLHLYLDNNKLHKLESKAMLGLENLKSLYLGQNGLISIEFGFFQPIQNMHHLSLQGNPLLTLEVLPSFMRIPKLLSLDLSSTSIKTIPKAFFSDKTLLQKLILSNNKIRELPGDALNKLRNLEMLDLSFNPIQELPTKAFYELGQLRVLIMNNLNSLKYLREGVFDGLISLESLYCSYNEKLEALHRWAFLGQRPVKRIREVILRGNSLVMLHEDTLPWRDIRLLDFRDNPWNCDCDISWMKDLKMSEKLSRQFKCSRPAFLAGKTIQTVNTRNFICKDPTSYATVLGIAFIVASLVIISLTMGLFLVFRFKICKKLQASKQKDYKVFSNKETVEIEIDGKILEDRIGVTYGTKDAEVNGSDDEECHYSIENNSKNQTESVA